MFCVAAVDHEGLLSFLYLFYCH